MSQSQPLVSLAHALAGDVSERTRAKGYAYFSRGAVGPIEGSDSAISVLVRGSRTYRVDIKRERDGYLGTCECPYFLDRLLICKHIWAAVLALDSQDLLRPVSANAWIDSGETDFSAVPIERPALQGPPRPAPPRDPSWQQSLNRVANQLAAPDAERRPLRYSTGEILYIIDPVMTLAGTGVVLNVHWRQRKKNGEWGKPQPAGIAAIEIDQLPEPIDREILSLLIGAADPYGVGEYGMTLHARSMFRLVGPLAERVLPLLARSGRLHCMSDPPGDALQPLAWDDGPPWTFRLEVTMPATDNIRVDGTFVRDGQEMSVSEPQLVVAAGYLVANETIARLDHGGAFAWLAELHEHGPATFPRHTAPKLLEALARANVAPELLPEEIRYGLVDVAPRPRVKVMRPSPSAAYVSRDDLQATVEFDYDGAVVGADRNSASFDAERKRLIRRRPAAEQAALQRLQQLGFRRGWSYDGRHTSMTVRVDQFPRAVRTLVREGWHVEADGRAFRAAQAMRVHVKSGVDWFELHGDVDFGDGRSAPLAEMLAALRRGDATVILDDGTRGMVPEEWLRRYARIAGFAEQDGDHFRYKPSQAMLLDALLERQPAVSIDETFARAREELKRFRGIRAVDPPSSFNGRLRDYQREALGWFDFLRRFGFGGCLADDMGLGKTVMVLALLETRRGERAAGDPRTSLAVVPRSLVFNWIDEASRFVPGLRVLDYTGSARADMAIEDHDLVLTTYGTLRRDAARLTEYEFDYVILDEAQAVKNVATASAKAVRLLRGRHRLALSGTPIENHVGELWSLFDFLNPGLLGTAAAFKRTSNAASGLAGSSGTRTGADQDDLAIVTQAIRPLILRRTKQQVAPELPARTEQTIHCELETTQRKFYDELRAHYRSSLLARVRRAGLNRSKMQILEALLRLRQAACHSGLVDPRRMAEPSAKFDVLLPQLTEVVEEGHKALVFSQFTSFLALLRARLEQDRIVYEYLDGQTRDRAERVERFNHDDGCRVFLVSLKAGGLGLNLTAAEYVFLLDPWWNPAVEAQAIDRAHRIGQSRHVFAYRLIARDTVEEKVAELQQSKRELADAILTADPALIRNLKPEDLEWLLS